MAWKYKNKKYGNKKYGKKKYSKKGKHGTKTVITKYKW